MPDLSIRHTWRDPIPLSPVEMVDFSLSFIVHFGDILVAIIRMVPSVFRDSDIPVFRFYKKTAFFFSFICIYQKKVLPLQPQRLKQQKMPSAEVQKMIPQIQAYLATQPVERAYLFGSCSRGEETKDSDIDILVKLDYSQPIGLRYFGMADDLEQQLGRKVDLVSEDGLLAFARPYVDHDKILLYERSHYCAK